MRIMLLSTIFITFFTHIGFAAEVLKGDGSAAANESFSFNVDQHDQTRTANQFALHTYVAAASDQAGLSKEFAIARIAQNQTQFTAMAPEKISFNPFRETQTVDGVEQTVTNPNEVTNPFYNNGVSFLTWLNGENSILSGSNEKLVLVAANDLTTIYLLNSFNKTIPKNSVLVSAHNLALTRPGSQNIPDATGAVTSGMMGIAAAAPDIFAAVKPTAGGSMFGDAGSGVAVIEIGSFMLSDKQNTGPTVVDAPTFSPLRVGGNRAAALDVTSDFLKIAATDLASFGQVVDMHWNPQTLRLYIALNVTGGAGGAQGARAIAIGRLVAALKDTTDSQGKPTTHVVNTQFVLEQIVPATVFDGSLNKVVGAMGSDVEVSIHKVRSMFASTAMPYLVGVGGVGSANSTKRKVFAMPLVIGNSDVSKNGTIAKKDATPKQFFVKTEGEGISIFLSRGITEQATTASDMPLATDAAVQVGGGDLVNGDITDLYVYEDTVYATVQNGDGNQLPGIFYSQAMFDETGKIKAWTTWRREAGTTDRVTGMEFDPSTGNKIFLSGDASGNVRTVKRTQWADGDNLKVMVTGINGAFSIANGGIQGLFDFAATSTTLEVTTPGLQNISMLVVTGLKQVMLVETSRVESGVVIPNQNGNFGSVEFFDEGTITKTFPTGNKMIQIQGGVLDDIGPISAAEVARDGSSGSNGWVFVGGIGGVAVLSQADGSGWDATTKLDPGFDGLVSGMAFKKFGEYSFVRKILNDGNYLYILTNTQLDRIDLTQGTPGLGTVTATTIATANEVVGTNGSFLDMVISEKVAILATSAGLFRSADGENVQTMNAQLWQQVTTPESIGPVRQLVSITKTKRAQDVSKQTVGGDLYALSGYRGKNQAQLFRYNILQTESNGVNGSTVERLPDFFVENIPSYFASYGIFRNIFATDGSLFFGSRSKHFENDPLLTVLNSVRTVGIFTSFPSRPLFNKQIDVNLSNSSIVSAVLKLSSSGTWLVGTDGGLSVNE